MSNFIFALNATIPIFLIIVLGYFLNRIKMVNANFIEILNKYVFKIALPVMLFKDIATTPIDKVYDPRFIAFCMIGTSIMFLAVLLFAEKFIKDKREIGAFTQAAARGSAAIFGIAFVQNIYGESGMTPMMIIAAVPLYNIYSVIILSIFGEKYPQDGSAPEHKGGKELALHTLKGIVTNPIILGIAAGFPFSLAGVSLPPIVLKTITSIGATATPMGLIAVGAAFEGRKAVKKLKQTLAASLIKLMVLPALFFPFAIMLGFRQSALVAILIMVGAPTTVSCYIMAKNMGNDDVLTSSIVVTTTLLSSVTLTFWLFILRTMGLI